MKLRRTSWRTILWLVVLGAVPGAFATWLLLRRGSAPFGGSVAIDATLLGLAAIVIGLGLNVRSYIRGNRPDLDPLHAARTLALAKAAVATGSVLTGWYGGQILGSIAIWDTAYAQSLAVGCGISAGCAAVLAAAGIVAEWFCQIPPEDKDKKGKRPGGGDPEAEADIPPEGQPA